MRRARIPRRPHAPSQGAFDDSNTLTLSIHGGLDQSYCAGFARYPNYRAAVSEANRLLHHTAYWSEGRLTPIICTVCNGYHLGLAGTKADARNAVEYAVFAYEGGENHEQKIRGRRVV